LLVDDEVHILLHAAQLFKAGDVVYHLVHLDLKLVDLVLTCVGQVPHLVKLGLERLLLAGQVVHSGVGVCCLFLEVIARCVELGLELSACGLMCFATVLDLKDECRLVITRGKKSV
jgi:hypothetical protein